MRIVTIAALVFGVVMLAYETRRVVAHRRPKTGERKWKQRVMDEVGHSRTGVAGDPWVSETGEQK